MLSRTIWMHLEVKQETEVHFLVGTVILGFLSIFKKRKASSPFEVLNSVCLSKCQSDMIPLVQMRRRPKAFSRDSTGDSDIPYMRNPKRNITNELTKQKETHRGRSQDGGGIGRVITFSSTNSLKEQQNGEQSLQNNF